MSYMSYCMFENSTNDMDGCIEALESNGWDIELMMSEASSEIERIAMLRFLSMCIDVAKSINEDDIDWSPLS